jgi:hypothetical protein
MPDPSYPLPQYLDAPVTAYDKQGAPHNATRLLVQESTPLPYPNSLTRGNFGDYLIDGALVTAADFAANWSLLAPPPAP